MTTAETKKNDSETAPFERVLVVDDTPEDLFIFRKASEKSSFAAEVIYAKSAYEALDILDNLISTSAKLPELLFLDIKMPGMDGFEFLRAFHQKKQLLESKIKIIMLTSSLNTDDKEQSGKFEKVTGFISKPINKNILASILESRNT